MKLFDTSKATPGQRVSDYQHIGGNYFVYAVMTRFNTVSWFVEDRATLCELTELPAIVKQEANFADAIKDFVF